MVSIKTLSKWLLVTAVIWLSGLVLIRIGYGNTNPSLRELCLVTGTIIILGATAAIVSEVVILLSVALSKKLKA